VIDIANERIPSVIIFVLLACIFAVGEKSYAGEIVSGEIFPELEFLNKTNSEFYYSVGVSLFSPLKTEEEMAQKASEMAAVFINFQKNTGVINEEAFVEIEKNVDNKAYQLVAPSSIEKFEHIYKNIELKKGIIYGHLFIGLFQYPRSDFRNNNNRVSISRTPRNIIKETDIDIPKWVVEMNSSVGTGESFALDDAFYKAYESAILALSRKLLVEVRTQITHINNYVQNIHITKQLISLQSVMILKNIRITHIKIFTLADHVRYRYRVYLKLSYETVLEKGRLEGVKK